MELAWNSNANHQQVAAVLRQALLSVGWTLRHDYVGTFQVRRGEYNLKVSVQADGVHVYLSRKTEKGGYKKVCKSRTAGDNRPSCVFSGCYDFGVLEPLS